MRSSSLAVALFVLLALGYGAYAQLSQTGMGGVSHGGVAPTCDGTIDLSTGCVQPMLGGL